MSHERNAERLANYIRIHRRRSGLSQRELEQILGYKNEGSVSQHELFQVMPPLRIAISYEIIFRSPVAELFGGLHDALARDIEDKLAALERELGQRSASGRDANATARKLMWLTARKHAAQEFLE